MVKFNMDRAVADVAEVVMFEQWIRFYYLVERDDQLIVEIPDEVMDAVAAQTPKLSALAKDMNQKAIDYQKSQEMICQHVSFRLESSKYGADLMPKVFDSKAFKIESYLFNLWLKGHESYFDAHEPATFSQWMSMYDEWKQMDEVKEYIAKIETSGQATMEPPSGTIH